MTDKYIDIVFDGPPAAESGRFVEVEDPNGASVNAGEWIDLKEKGMWALRLRPADLEHALYEMPTSKGWYLDKDGNPVHVDGDTYHRDGQHAYGSHQFRQYAPFTRLLSADQATDGYRILLGDGTLVGTPFTTEAAALATIEDRLKLLSPTQKASDKRWPDATVIRVSSAVA